MLKNIIVGFLVITFAFGILFTSILRTAEVRYSFSNGNGEHAQVLGDKKEMTIDYYLPYSGKILPDNPLWFLKAFRDKVWLVLTTNSGKKAELKLLFADKRLVSSKLLFEKDKPNLAFGTLTKAEKYLEESLLQENINREKGEDTSSFLLTLSKASLKHRQVIDEILVIAPDDAKPEIITVQNYSITVFEKVSQILQSKGIKEPENPFDIE